MPVSYPTKVLLAFRSGDVCAFARCQKQLTTDGHSADPAIIGEAAHIAGEHEKAARYNASMTDEERNHYDNLIYLCRDHHAHIDKQEADFPVDYLLTLKAEHEPRVRKAMHDAFVGVGFPELEEATQWVMRVKPDRAEPEFVVVPPEEKIRKNELTNRSRTTITMGLSVSREVGKYIETVAQTDPDFPEQLRSGFLREYYRLRGEGHRGDELFDLMCGFAQQGFNDQCKRSAGLAVLIHFFELCEVFEK